MSTKDRVIVIGAGMGGLALALALLRQGRKVSVFEAALQLAEIGAGLSLSPNATHALNYLGLNDYLAKAANRPRDTILSHYRTGEALVKQELGEDFLNEFGAEYYQIHRADMHAGLVDAVTALDPSCITLGSRFVDFSQDENSITATFANGKSATGTLLVGADGIRSTLRSKLVDETPPKFTGQVAYRATLDARGLEPLAAGADSSVTVGPGHIFVRYLIRHQELLNVVAIAKSDAWKEEGWNTPASKDELLAEHQGWNDEILDLIRKSSEGSFYKWALFDREPMAEWNFGRATLLGDAAHPMLPFLGMGAAMAFEDAVVLSRCLENFNDQDIALARYKAARHERTSTVLQTSREHGERLQSSDPDKVDWSQAKGGNDWTFFTYNPVAVEI